MKKWLIPLAYPIIFIVTFLFIGALLGWGDVGGTGYGGAVIFLCCLIFCFVIVIPIICFLYSKRCLSGQRYGFLFTLYQSLLITLPYFATFIHEDETAIYALILFAWCELWSLLGLANSKKKAETHDE